MPIYCAAIYLVRPYLFMYTVGKNETRCIRPVNRKDDYEQKKIFSFFRCHDAFIGSRLPGTDSFSDSRLRCGADSDAAGIGYGNGWQLSDRGAAGGR